MKKFSKFFGKILHIFLHQDFIRAMREARAEKSVKGFTCLKKLIGGGQLQNIRLSWTAMNFLDTVIRSRLLCEGIGVFGNPDD